MVDQEKIQQAVALLLEGMGEDVQREGLQETPQRVARMYAELCRGMDESAAEHLSTTFEHTGSGMVLERDIQFHSLCEHHLLPFFGTASVAYLPGPGGRVCGISKLARCVDVFARRLQIQERLTAQVARAVEDGLGARGVLVRMEAEHMCMSMRGVGKPGSQTVTSCALGVFKDDEGLRARAERMARE